MDNVDTDGRRCVSVFAPLCVHIYKGHQSHHPPQIGEYIDKRPAEGVQLSRPPDMNDTDNEGKASTDEKETDPDTDKYRQHGQTPAALRLYTTHKNGRPLRIENGRKIITSKYGQPPTAACKYMPIYLHAAKIRKAAHKTESQRSKEKHPAEGVQRPHSPPEYGQRGQYGQTPAALRLYKHTGTRGKHRKRKSKQPQPTRNKPPPDIDNEGNAPTYGEEKTAPAPFFCPCAAFALYGATL